MHYSAYEEIEFFIVYGGDDDKSRAFFCSGMMARVAGALADAGDAGFAVSADDRYFWSSVDRFPSDIRVERFTVPTSEDGAGELRARFSGQTIIIKARRAGEFFRGQVFEKAPPTNFNAVSRRSPFDRRRR